MTAVCKATFELVQGQAPLARAQDSPNEADNHWNDEANCSLYSASDLAPFKARADVMLVGKAYAPSGKPASSVVARLLVRSIDKAIEVCRDRHFNQQDELIEGKRFTTMALRFERAAGGLQTTNPVGIDPEGERDRYGRLAVPNLQPVGTTVSNRNDLVPTVGFGPIASTWSARRSLLGRHASTWSDARWHKQPLPTDIDGAYFNASPIDQRLDEL